MFPCARATAAWVSVGIGAAVDYVGDALAKAAADFFQHGSASAVFDDVVQERGDGEIFVAPGFEHKRGDAHQMGDVWDRRCFARLAGMHFCCEEKRS